jgi:putative peptidoglycan lipid II flippase
MKNFGAIRKRISNLNPDHHAIVRGMLWVALFVFLGKLAGAAKEMVIAYRYGVSEEVDAYLFVFNLICWPVSVWFPCLCFVLVPLAARIRQDAMADLPRFRAELLAFTLVLGCDLALIAWFGLPVLLRSSWVGLSKSTLSIALDIVPDMVALIPLGILVSLFSAWMLSSERHANTLLEGVPALAILVALLILPHDGVSPLVWGTLAGFIFHAASLAVPLAWKGEIEMPRFTSHAPQWSAFWQGFGVLLVGNTLMSFIGIIDQFFAAHLGTGVIATLSYANRVLALIIGLGTTTVSRATLPVFSKIKSQEEEHLQRIAMLWVRLMFALGVFALIISWWLAPWAVKFLFERGAFTPKDTEAVTEVFRYGLMQLPFYFSCLVLVSLLASRRHHKLIAIGASINLFIKIGANYALVPLMGIYGIITATAIMYMVSFITLYWFAVKSYKTTGKQHKTL